MIRCRESVLVLVAALLIATPDAGAQRLYASDVTGGITWEIAFPPGGACSAPAPFVFPCPNAFSLCPGVPVLTPPPPGSSWGDIADDPVADVVYVTDGRTVVVHAGDAACATFTTPCVPIDQFVVPPTTPPMGPVTGMGCDASGALAGGLPLLWITDGASIAGIVPPLPGTCTAATVLFPPCALPPAATPATDVSWDPAGGVLWVLASGGTIVPVLPSAGCTAGPPVAVSSCVTPPLTGLAYDTTTPDALGNPPAAYVTDGVSIARIDLTTGLAALPTFAAPVPCAPAPAPLDGLAFALHGNTYGTSRVFATLDTHGQASTPGPSFGLDLTGVPVLVPAWGILNYNIPGPGYACPALPGIGTNFWVLPGGPPGRILYLGALPPGTVCPVLPAPIPAGLPPGIELFVQVVFWTPGATTAVDATNGVAITIGLP